MGRELQKRKRRSSRPTIRQSHTPKKPLNPLGNGLIARNWNKRETLSQNYRRLGLTAKLGRASGGVEPRSSSSATTTTGAFAPAHDPLAVTAASGFRAGVSSVQVERDADGNIVRVLHKKNPLNDPLNDLESDSEEEEEDDDDDNEDDKDDEEEEGGGKDAAAAAAAGNREMRVVDLLEQQANIPTEKRIRHQSAREREWIERLVAKHGDNTAAMARDAKLNPMQQTEGELRRKLQNYKGKTGQ